MKRIDDSISLETADAGIAMGSGLDIARESGDIILLKPVDLDLIANLNNKFLNDLARFVSAWALHLLNSY